MSIAEKIAIHRKERRQVVVVQGLGFVGIAVAATIAGARDKYGKPLYLVIGVDLPSAEGQAKVDLINSGIVPIKSPDQSLYELLREGVIETQNLCATTTENVYEFADVILVAINLDVSNRSGEDHNGVQVRMQDFNNAIKSIGRLMSPDALLMIETTVPPGTCEKIVLPILLGEFEKRGISSPPYLAHAYERVMPGPNYIDSIRKYWRTFSGIDERSAERARAFLESYIDTASYPLSQLAEPLSSELGKILENSYRAVNIAFIHEWTLLAEKIGVDLFAIVNSIKVRKGTHDNIRFPGFGVGGYCLTKDSLFAQWSANNLFQTDLVMEMTLQALRTNYLMPLHTLDLLVELAAGDICDKRIGVCGVSYLPEVGDSRNSPSELLVDKLIEAGANVIVHDPLLDKWPERPQVYFTNSLEECLSSEGVIFTVPHQIYKESITEAISSSRTSRPSFLVDAQNIISDANAELLYRAGCRLAGVGKGHWRKLNYHRPV